MTRIEYAVNVMGQKTTEHFTYIARTHHTLRRATKLQRYGVTPEAAIKCAFRYFQMYCISLVFHLRFLIARSYALYLLQFSV